MAKKKKRSSSSSPPSDKTGLAPFNRPFANLKLPSQKENTSRDAKVEGPKKTITSATKSATKSSQQVSTPKNQPEELPVAPNETSLFLSAIIGTSPIEGRLEKINKSKAGQYVENENAMVVAQLQALVEKERTWEIESEDDKISGRANGVNQQLLDDLEKGRWPVNRKLDLHGFTLSEAFRLLQRFLFDARRDGERCVLIITGKGQHSEFSHGRLRDHVPEWLSKEKLGAQSLAFTSAPTQLGGTGALLVLLRKAPQSR
ncbi:MAG: Smr/MutS family protein [Myxococcota bacterium]|nr:Smr/MutS family protein [Myxococcota bacterium]